MKLKIVILYVCGLILPLTAQNGYEQILIKIEENSPTLNALRKQADAQKEEAKTGIYLPDPEFEFTYLWGNTLSAGDEIDFSVSQSFDFPTAYSLRRKISKQEISNADLLYRSERMDVLLEAKRICVELTYYNALAKINKTRLENALKIGEVFEVRLANGEANILESNKAQMNYAMVVNEIARIDTERKVLLNELKRMNGGKEITFLNYEFEMRPLPTDFETWYSQMELKNPILQNVKGQIDVSQQQVRLNKALGLPKFSAGYVNEKVADERSQGLMVGVSIPLWENRNQVKYAQAQVRAVESLLDDSKKQFYTRLQNLYNKSLNLQQNAIRYRETLSKHDNKPLLKAALNAGEIPLLDYLIEVQFYYEMMNTILETERDFELNLAELSAVEL